MKEAYSNKLTSFLLKDRSETGRRLPYVPGRGKAYYRIIISRREHLTFRDCDV
jgi:hypothetical protein